MRPVRRWWIVLLTPLLVAGLGSCVFGFGSGPDSAESTRTLDQQRLDVRQAVREILERAETPLGGRLDTGQGRFEGCTSGGLNHFEDVRYRFDATIRRVVEAPLDDLVTLFEQAGFTVTDTDASTPLGRTVRAERAGVSVSAYVLPEGGGGLALRAAGECVGVPKKDSDDWLTRRDNEPL